MSIQWAPSQEPTAAPSLPHVPLTPAFSLASIFTPFSPDHFPLTPFFSIRRFHSFSFFFTLKSVSPLLATHSKSTRGCIPQIFFDRNIAPPRGAISHSWSPKMEHQPVEVNSLPLCTHIFPKSGRHCRQS